MTTRGLAALAMIMLIADAMTNLAMAQDAAQTLDGVYNTGRSTIKEANGASLNIRFHSCDYDPALSCATVLSVDKPDGPSGANILPDGDPIVGYLVVKDLKSKGHGKYRGGKIAALDESMVKGKMIWYGLKVNELGDGDLEAKGCLGFLCPRTMIWRNASAPSEGATPESKLSADET